uniref:Homeobox domain-containing protein n=1 Tax=Chelydra serpentina TaxID=8475 RepID=A0A8C3RSS9_CHESE
MLHSLNEWLWWHEYWLPPGITWEDMKESEDIHYPQPQDLLLSIPCALLLIIIRYLFERFVARPLGRKLGLRDKVRLNAPPNPVLETFYATHSKDPKEGQLISLSKQCDLPTRKVERWFRYRRNQDKPSLTTKFCEILSLLVLQPLLPSVFWYYMLELSFYFSLVCTLPFDVKRKDLTQQIVHHGATIFLISFSYCANYLRIGTLVMVIHDASDCILEPTKIFNYMKWRRICDGLFIIFSAVFLLTRLLIFPYKHCWVQGRAAGVNEACGAGNWEMLQQRGLPGPRERGREGKEHDERRGRNRGGLKGSISPHGRNGRLFPHGGNVTVRQRANNN